MSTINITRDTSGKVSVNFDLPNLKLDLKFQADEIDITLNSEEFQIPSKVEESPEERKRRKAREYYEANKEKLREKGRQRYHDKKPVIVQEPVPIVEENQEPPAIEEDPMETAEREQRREYYQNRIQTVRQWYQDNKDRIAKRQQTDEARARSREQYHKRQANKTKKEITARNAKSVAQRKVRDDKLRVKYPGMKLKHAKAAEKAAKAAAAI